MKITCPTCFAGQKVRDDLIHLPVPCKKCGQPFVASDVQDQPAADEAYPGHSPDDSRYSDDLHDDVDSDVDVEVIDDFSDEFVVEFAVDLRRVSRAMSYLLMAYCGIVISFFALLFVLVTGFLHRDAAGVERVAILIVVVMGLALMSGIFWVVAQFKLRASHPKGSAMRGMMSKSLKMSVAGIFTKIVAGSSGITALKAVGSLMSASAFDSFLLYFQMLCRQLGDIELSERVGWLASFYRQMLWILFITAMLMAFSGRGNGIAVALAGFGAIGFIVCFTVFAFRLGAMIRDVRQLTRRTSLNARWDG